MQANREMLAKSTHQHVVRNKAPKNNKWRDINIQKKPEDSSYGTKQALNLSPAIIFLAEASLQKLSAPV